MDWTSFKGVVKNRESQTFSFHQLSLRANDTGQLFPSWIQWTWQRSTEDFNRVDQCVVLVYSTSCDLRCLVPANVAAAFSVRVTSSVRDEISNVLCGPAVRTLYSCWNHGNRGPTSHVAKCTRRWIITQCITVVVACGEYISPFIFYPGNLSSPRLSSICIIVPLWIVR